MKGGLVKSFRIPMALLIAGLLASILASLRGK